MSNGDARALARSYRRAHYRVSTGSGLVTLRVGEPNAAIARLLTGHGVCCAAQITADNPGSVVTSIGENRDREAALARRLADGGWTALPAFGEDPDGRWPDESGFLVLGIDRRRAVRMGRDFGQNAVLLVDERGLASVAWCDGAAAASAQNVE